MAHSLQTLGHLTLGLALFCAAPTSSAMASTAMVEDSSELVQSLCDLESAHRSRVARLERLRHLARARSDQKTVGELRSLFEQEEKAYQERREELRDQHGRARVARAQADLGISSVRGTRLEWDLKEGSREPMAEVDPNRTYRTVSMKKESTSTEGAPGSPTERGAKARANRNGGRKNGQRGSARAGGASKAGEARPGSAGGANRRNPTQRDAQKQATKKQATKKQATKKQGTQGSGSQDQSGTGRARDRKARDGKTKDGGAR